MAVVLPVQRFSSGPYFFIFWFTIPVTDCHRMVFEPQHHVSSVFDRIAQVLGIPLSTSSRCDSCWLFWQTVVITTAYVTRQPSHRTTNSSHRYRAYCNEYTHIIKLITINKIYYINSYIIYNITCYMYIAKLYVYWRERFVTLFFIKFISE